MSALKLKLSRQEFAGQVEAIVNNGDTDYFDAIFTVCEQNEIEPETAGSYVVGTLKEKLSVESRQMKRLRSDLNEEPASLIFEE